MSQVGKVESPATQLEEPSFEDGKPLLIAGLKERLSGETMKNIPELWQRFGRYFGNIPGQVGRVAYGICSNMVPSPFGFDYMAGVEVSGTSGFPNEFSHVSVPAMRYVIFPHREHVSSLPKTIDAVHQNWLPGSGHVPARVDRDAPIMMERYGEGFDAQKGIAGRGESQFFVCL